MQRFIDNKSKLFFIFIIEFGLFTKMLICKYFPLSIDLSSSNNLEADYYEKGLHFKNKRNYCRDETSFNVV